MLERIKSLFKRISKKYAYELELAAHKANNNKNSIT